MPKGTQLSEKTKQATLKSFAMLHITGAGNVASFPFGHVPTRGTTDEQHTHNKTTKAENHKRRTTTNLGGEGGAVPRTATC